MSKHKWLVMGIVLIVAGLLWVLLGSAKPDKHSNAGSGLKVGFVMTGNTAESGYNHLHYEGIRRAAADLGVDVLMEQNVLEYTGKCNDAVDRLVNQGAGAIFLSSLNYYQEVKPIVDRHPRVIFYVTSFDNASPNLVGYFLRYYQIRYLAGLIAGSESKTGRIGYVAAMRNDEVNRGINAFTLGVRAANPKAQVFVRWTGNWDAPDKERANVRRLIAKQGVDLVTYHQNRLAVLQEAEAQGIMSIGYNEKMPGASPKLLTSIVGDWKNTYEYIMQMLLNGQGDKKKEFWLGYRNNAVGLAPYSELVRPETRALVENKRRLLQTKDFIFQGDIYDNTGVKRCSEKLSLTDEQLVHGMDWLAEGVVVCED